MTTFLSIPGALNDPSLMQAELEQDFSGGVLELNQWTILDWTLMLKRIDAALGGGIYDKWSELDPLLAIDCINAALS